MPIDASLPYDDNNIFARILRGEAPRDVATAAAKPARPTVVALS